MNSMTKSNFNRKKAIIICLLAVLVVGVATACVFIALNSPQSKATDSENNTLEQAFDIETPYVTLNYPLKWKNEILTKCTDSDVYTVEFYKLFGDEYTELHLFDIAFGGTNGDVIGNLSYNNDTLEVRVISYEIGDNWSEDEISVIGEMLDDVNFIIDSLQNCENFRGV